MATSSSTCLSAPPLSRPSPSSYGIHYSPSSYDVTSRLVKVSCSVPQAQLLLSPVDKTLSQIKSSGVIACLRANSAELVLEAARAAIEGGISVLEIVVSTPGVFEVLKQLVREYPMLTLGVGTVLKLEDAKSAVSAGAKFLMSPAMVQEILQYVLSDEVLYIPGVMTPTEILSAYSAGANIVKVYPVSALGGSKYISSLRKPFPHISMVASQGITIDLIGEYIARGSSSVVLSDAIFDKEAMAQKDFNTIYQLAHSATLMGKEAVQREDIKAAGYVPDMSSVHDGEDAIEELPHSHSDELDIAFGILNTRPGKATEYILEIVAEACNIYSHNLSY